MLFVKCRINKRSVCTSKGTERSWTRCTLCESFVGNEPFAVMLGDDVVVAEKPCLSQLIEQFDKYNATVLGVQKVGMDQVSKYGIVDCDNVEGRMYKLKGMVEKPKKEDAPSDVAVLGRYVITPAIFGCLEKHLRVQAAKYSLPTHL